MKIIYLKYFLVCGILFFNLISSFRFNASAQYPPVKFRKIDKTDLLNNIHAVDMDKRKIAAITLKIQEARNRKDESAMILHRKRLSQQKSILKRDIKKMKDEQDAFVKIKTNKIAILKNEVEKSKERYEQKRIDIKKDLAKKNDWALRKDVDELMSAQEMMKEKETELSMETSDLKTTIAATRHEWKKLNINSSDTADSEEPRLHPKNLSAK